MTPTELQAFCDEEDEARFYLRAPWSREGSTWATNGRIIVRVPAIEGIPDVSQAPDVLKLFTEAALGPAWMAVPEMTMPADIPCRWCDGTKRDPNDRRYKCQECNGTGLEHDQSGIDFAGTTFAKRYLALIQGWEIAPNGQKAAHIRNGDATGLLMPMRK